VKDHQNEAGEEQPLHMTTKKRCADTPKWPDEVCVDYTNNFKIRPSMTLKESNSSMIVKRIGIEKDPGNGFSVWMLSGKTESGQVGSESSKLPKEQPLTGEVGRQRPGSRIP
jgi:hypothetical protein